MNAERIIDTITDRELAERVVSRRDAVRRTGTASAALAIASVPVALAAMARSAFAQGLPQQIVDTLNFALTLEYLEAEFYVTGLGASGLIPSADLPIFQQISRHESAHVAYLQAALGASAVAKPTFDFTAGGAFADVFSSYDTFKAVAQAFEDTGVRAYKGQAGNLMSNDDILTVALQIHSVEARHASEVRRLRGRKGWVSGNATDVAAIAAVYAGEDNVVQAGVMLPGGTAASEAFDEPLSKDAVLAIAGQFIVA